MFWFASCRDSTLAVTSPVDRAAFAKLLFNFTPSLAVTPKLLLKLATFSSALLVA